MLGKCTSPPSLTALLRAVQSAPQLFELQQSSRRKQSLVFCPCLDYDVSRELPLMIEHDQARGADQADGFEITGAHDDWNR